MDTDTEEVLVELRGWDGPESKIQSFYKVDTAL